MLKEDTRRHPNMLGIWCPQSRASTIVTIRRNFQCLDHNLVPYIPWQKLQKKKCSTATSQGCTSQNPLHAAFNPWHISTTTACNTKAAQQKHDTLRFEIICVSANLQERPQEEGTKKRLELMSCNSKRLNCILFGKPTKQ